MPPACYDVHGLLLKLAPLLCVCTQCVQSNQLDLLAEYPSHPCHRICSSEAPCTTYHGPHGPVARRNQQFSFFDWRFLSLWLVENYVHGTNLPASLFRYPHDAIYASGWAFRCLNCRPTFNAVRHTMYKPDYLTSLQTYVDCCCFLLPFSPTTAEMFTQHYNRRGFDRGM